MGADFSRVRANPLLDFTGVELKQGGVLLDADFNELVAATDRRLRALASDVLGRATVSSTTPEAFKIGVAAGGLTIARGRLYVDGLLAENHGAESEDAAKKELDPLLTDVRYADALAYADQPYLPNAPALPQSGKHLVYLDVWQRELTHLEHPGLVEIALGVETSSRVQTVWQVRVLGPDARNATCASADEDFEDWTELIAPSGGRLTTGTYEVENEGDPCELPPTGGYRGLENQTYRVEIHEPGAPGGGASFKWSRDNASVGSRVASVVSATELELQTLGRDDVLRFNSGDWVEVIDDVREASQRCGEMRTITVNEAARRITFEPALPGEMLPGTFPDSDFARTRNLRVRRWDHKHKVLQTGAGGTTSVFHDLDASADGVIPVPAAGTTLLLENGVTVSFSSIGAKGFRAGDYWVFAARSADASVEPLTDAPPRGIHHHYARLGIWDVGAGTVTDCRTPWPPPVVEGHDCGCTACVTEKSHASGEFTIQDAVNRVRETGGTVCLQPGRYAVEKPVQVNEARSVRIRGQGPATVIASAGTVFQVQTGLALAIENLAIVSLGQAPAIAVRSAVGLSLRRLVIAVTEARGSGDAAIALQGVVAAVSIRENAIVAPAGIVSGQSESFARMRAFVLVAALEIEDNLLWCRNTAVALGKNVLHLLGTRIAGNQVLGCLDTAIEATGMGLPGSSLAIDANRLNVNGNGIACGVDGLWIEGNKVTSTAKGAAERQARSGIALVAGLDNDGADQCHLLSNQVSGFSRAGIFMSAPGRELMVKHNIVEHCGNGILCAEDAAAGSVSVENNHVRDIGSEGEATEAMVIGIGIVRSESATIAGNTVSRLGAGAQKLQLRAGILTMGVGRVRVSGNELSDIAAGQDFSGLAAGILLRAPYERFDVTQNRVQREADESEQGGAGAWLALGALDLDRGDALPKDTGLTTLRADDNRVLVLAGSHAYMHAMPHSAAADTQTGAGARGAVLGNDLSARGSAPAVHVTAAGECLFNDNRVELRGNDRGPAVHLRTHVAIVNANRVRGGEAAIRIEGARSAAVLGNITTGAIEIPGGLQPPWDALNLRA